MLLEYSYNIFVLRCLSEKDKKLIGIFVVGAANEYLHRCARLVYSALLAQNALISTVFSPLLASFATTSEAIRRDILDLPFGTSERGEREKSCMAAPSNAKNESRERTICNPPKAPYFSAQKWSRNGTVIIKSLCFSAPQLISYGILESDKCTSDCADIALHLCQRCTPILGGESATSGIPPTPEKKFRVASAVEVYSLHFCAPAGVGCAHPRSLYALSDAEVAFAFGG